MRIPNYEAIEAISIINIASQSLQHLAVHIFSTIPDLKNINTESEEYKQIILIQTQTKKLRDNADKILSYLEV